MSILVVCDKCKAEIKNDFITKFVNPARLITIKWRREDILLCNKCNKEFKEWLKQ